MSIDRVNISNQGIERSQAQPNELTRAAGRDRQNPAAAGSDSVAFSTKANELNRLAGTIEQFRTERFNQVRSAIESGTYHVSAEALAQKLIELNSK